MKFNFTLRQLSMAMALSGLFITIPVLSDNNIGVAHAAQQNTQVNEVLNGYASQAYHWYKASLDDAQALQKAIKAFTKAPTAASLEAAKKAWLQSRESYGLTEVFRLSGGPIDAEEGWIEEAYGNLESQINAWPLDEVMIDYTLDANGKRTKGNIIDSKGKFTPVGEDAEKKKKKKKKKKIVR